MGDGETATVEPKTEETTKREGTVTVGLYAEPGLTDLAEEVGADLPDELRERFPEVEWQVEIGEELPKDPAADTTELVRAVRRRLVDEGLDFAICLTGLPLRSGPRPVTAHASATEGVGLISVPALGAVAVEDRVRETVLNLIEGLVGQSLDDRGAASSDGRRERIRERLGEVASPIGRPQVRGDRIRFVGEVVRGNLRLLVGMVRANDPWRVVVRLSRAMVAAIGTAAWVLASSGVWNLGVGMTWPRLLGLSVVAVLATSTTLIASHDLWERSSNAEEHERVVLFNAVTTITIGIGVLTLYLALFLFSVVCAFGLIPEAVLGKEIGADPGAIDYVHLAWLGASMATLAGALGSMTESDLAVREAAYRHHPDARNESGER